MLTFRQFKDIVFWTTVGAWLSVIIAISWTGYIHIWGWAIAPIFIVILIIEYFSLHPLYNLYYKKYNQRVS